MAESNLKRSKLLVKPIYLLVGMAVGLVAGPFIGGQPVPVAVPVVARDDQAQPTPSTEGSEATRICQGELAQARAQIQVLTKRVEVAGSETHSSEQSQPRDEAERPSAQEEAVSWRVSAIEKFVPLTEEQRQRLRQKFSNQAAEQAGETEKLEEIIGEESAAFYRQQVQAAFQKARDESIEKEVVWVARQVGLSAEAEEKLRGVFSAVEQQLVDERRARSIEGATPQQRIRAMIAENRRRAELRNEQIKPMLSPQQYEQFLKSQAESSDSDVEIFHGAG